MQRGEKERAREKDDERDALWTALARLLRTCWALATGIGIKGYQRASLNVVRKKGYSSESHILRHLKSLGSFNSKPNANFFF